MGKFDDDDDRRGSRATRLVEYVVEWFTINDQGDGREYEVVHHSRHGSATDARDVFTKVMAKPDTFGHDLRKHEMIPGSRWVSQSILTEDEAADVASRLIEVRGALHDAVHPAATFTPPPADEGPAEAPAGDPVGVGGRVQRPADADRGGRGADGGLRPDWLEG